MAGLGRRTHYRKHLTDQIMYDLPEPLENECIAQVVSTRGSNQFDIKLSDSEVVLAILPTKFRKLVWVKRNDYVIAQTVDEEEENEDNNTGGIRYMITTILYKDQIQHLKSKGLWPEEFQTDFQDEAIIDPQTDGIVYQEDDNDDTLFVNNNRLAKIVLEDSSSSSEEEEGQGGED